MTTIHETACIFHTHGIQPLPVRNDSSKAPAVTWHTYQKTGVPAAQIDAWFNTGAYDGLGVITGAISNNLEMLELEGKAAHLLPALASKLEHSLWAKLCTYMEQTPSGGYHFYYFLEHPPTGNTKLARRPATPEEFADDIAAMEADLIQLAPEKAEKRRQIIRRLTPARRPRTLIETRGEGGFTITAPSTGRAHPTGKPWIILNGTPQNIPTLTPTEHESLFDVCRGFDQMPETATQYTLPQPDPRPINGLTRTLGVRPGDDYNNKTSWEEILTPYGWKIASRTGTGIGWTRPGKKHGISATTGTAADGVDRLYVFSTSTEFEPETPYTKFAAYTLLNHDGNYNKAAKQLTQEGYGTPTQHLRPNTLDTFINNKTKTTPTITVVEPDTYTQTDDGNALRFADTYKNQYAYIPEHHTWAKWDGHKWETTTAEPQAIQAALHLARTLPETTKTDQTHKKRALSKTGITNMLHLASTHPNILKPLTLFDANPYQLNTPTGIINLRTQQITPPTPTQHCLRSTNVAPKNTPTPCWDNFLADTFAGEPQLTEYVQKFLGMTLIGQVREQIFAFFNGSGANGKSTLLNVIQKILGTNPDGYTASIPSNVFIKGAENRHPTEIASLQGVRLAITSETEEGQYFAEARIKLLTGADNISARFMHGDFFTFTPSHTIIMVSNHEPEVASGGDAFWRRVRKIPFLNTVPVENRDPELENKLMSEAEGILAWLINGCHKYLTEGLQEPDVVKVATREYEREQNTVAQFLSEACVVHESNRNLFNVRVAQLRSRYEQWCRVNGLDPVGSRALGNQLKKAGIKSVANSGYRYYSGISFKADFENLMDGVL